MNVCDQVDTGVRTGFGCQHPESRRGGIGGETKALRSHPANSHPVPPTTGLCSLTADQPDTLSSSLGSAVPACQESRQHSPALLPAARGKTFSADTSGTRPGIRMMTVDDSRSVLNNQDRRAGACVVSLSWH